MFQWRRQRADQIACQQANQALSARFAAIREAMAMIVFTPQGVVIDANNKFLQLMEYRLEEVQGEHHRIFVLPHWLQAAIISSFGSVWREVRASLINFCVKPNPVVRSGLRRVICRYAKPMAACPK